VTVVDSGDLRVALVLHRDAPASTRTAINGVQGGLAGTAVKATVVTSHSLPEALLRKRGFTGPLTHMPGAVARLWLGRYDLVHAFSVPDAQSGLWWRRLTGRPVVFTATEVLDRGNVANRRLRLKMLAAAVEETDAAVAASEPVRDALSRWMAADLPLLEPQDGAAHERLYRGLIAQT
jgi:hypothetical protein